ncbi:MAG: hypothetical protein K8S94_17660 [Planctomycetia bacterium]|nr:hypothetical protein [Planctomycetia bacterium]
MRPPHHGGMPAGGPRPDAMRKLDEIIGRLSRIEAKLGGRGEDAGSRAGDRPRPAVPAEARAMMEKRMEEGRRRMEEGREKMEQARKRFAEMEERIKKLEAEVERLKAAP